MFYRMIEEQIDKRTRRIDFKTNNRLNRSIKYLLNTLEKS